MMRRNVVLDCGGGSIVAGWGGSNDPVRTVPNMIAKVKAGKATFVADQIDDCKDISSIGIRRPFDRGYLVGWGAQKDIWDRVFKGVLGCQPSECGLLMTEPLFNLPGIEERTDQILFEEYRFQSYLPAPGPVLALRQAVAEAPGTPAAEAMCGLVLDSGFSFTHAVPVFDGRVLNYGVRRVNIGGKAITNLLKETVSFRSINMMEETHVMEDVKEQLCFVSQDLRADLVASKVRGSPFRREYILPDGVSNIRGFVRPLPGEPGAAGGVPQTPEGRGRPGGGGAGAGGAGAGGAGGPSPYKDSSERQVEEQVLVLNNERFTVPEALFRPADLGFAQAGIAEALVQAVTAVHSSLHGLLWSNVVVVGGCAKLPGFKERLLQELRPLVPDEFALEVHLGGDPAACAWRGGAGLAAGPEYERRAMTRTEYEEEGSQRCRRRVAAMW